MRTHAQAAVLFEFLKQHQSYDENEAKERIETLKEDPNVQEIYDDHGQIQGVMQTRRSNNFIHGPSASITIGCEQNEKIIAKAEVMLIAMLQTLRNEGVNMVVSVSNDSFPLLEAMLTRHGMKPWYGYVFMKHDGRDVPVSPLTKRPIQPEDFMRYHRVMGECFVPMRQAMDIRPYDVIDQILSDSEKFQKTYDEWLENAHSSWMYFDQDEWVGAGLFYNQDIDDVFIPPNVQGKGYGRMITHDLIHEAKKRGFDPYIGYVKWNERAGKLYLSCGFIPFLSVTYHRMFLTP